MAKPCILIIEDDAEIRELVSYNLGREGYIILQAASAEEGLALCAATPPALVLLDIMLPGIDGLEALRRIRAIPAMASVPVIMTTAKGEDADVVAGLELGADDYMTKPFSPRVLVARVRTALRRTAEGSGKAHPKNNEGILRSGDMILDPGRHEFSAGGTRIELSATEFAILALLLKSPGRVFSRERIIDSVKGTDYPVTDRAVDVHIVSLRKKLGGHSGAVETVRGIGYRLKDES